MSVALFLAAGIAAADLSPAEAQNAIWADLQLNALVGNGNWLASLWYNAGAENPDRPDLHIQGLACRKRGDAYRCFFNLHREGGVGTAFGEVAPDNLACSATLRRVGDRELSWSVHHLPPPRRGGHSRTTMRCKARGAA